MTGTCLRPHLSEATCLSLYRLERKIRYNITDSGRPTRLQLLWRQPETSCWQGNHPRAHSYHSNQLTDTKERLTTRFRVTQHAAPHPRWMRKLWDAHTGWNDCCSFRWHPACIHDTSTVIMLLCIKSSSMPVLHMFVLFNLLHQCNFVFHTDLKCGNNSVELLFLLFRHFPFFNNDELIEMRGDKREKAKTGVRDQSWCQDESCRPNVIHSYACTSIQSVAGIWQTTEKWAAKLGIMHVDTSTIPTYYTIKHYFPSVSLNLAVYLCYFKIKALYITDLKTRNLFSQLHSSL